MKEIRGAEPKNIEKTEDWKITFDAIKDGILLLDSEQKIMRNNCAMSKIFPNKEMTGKQCWEIVHGGNKPIEECPAKRMMISKKRESMEYKIDDQYFEIIVDPILDNSGNINGCVHSMRKITERIRNKLKLEESKRTLLESQKVAILGSYEMEISTGNWTSSEILDEIFGIDDDFNRNVEGWSSILHPDWRQAMIDYLTNEILGQHKRFDKEYKIIRINDGAERWVLGLGELKVDHSGEPIMMVGTIQDITERKQVEEKLRKQQKTIEALIDQRTKELEEAKKEIVRQERLAVLGQLSGAVSHELRNPLGVISNSIYFLKECRANTSQDVIDKYYDIISYESEVSTKIITDMLNYGKEVKPEHEVLMVSELILNTLSKLHLSEDSNVDVKISISPEDLSARFDRELMEIAIEHLFENAYQEMRYHGTLTIRALLEKDEVKIMISDTGEGIKLENFDNIFQPLYSTKIKGIGLGLAITKKYIEANQGRIEFDSEVGKGSVFTISLLAK